MDPVDYPKKTSKMTDSASPKEGGGSTGFGF